MVYESPLASVIMIGKVRFDQKWKVLIVIRPSLKACLSGYFEDEHRLRMANLSEMYILLDDKVVQLETSITGNPCVCTRAKTEKDCMKYNVVKNLFRITSCIGLTILKVKVTNSLKLCLVSSTCNTFCFIFGNDLLRYDFFL